MKKIYYSLKELSELLNEKPHVLRYWEQQFPLLTANRSKTGVKLYTQSHIDKFSFVQEVLRSSSLSVSALKQTDVLKTFINKKKTQKIT